MYPLSGILSFGDNDTTLAGHLRKFMFGLLFVSSLGWDGTQPVNSEITTENPETLLLLLLLFMLKPRRS